MGGRFAEFLGRLRGVSRDPERARLAAIPELNRHLARAQAALDQSVAGWARRLSVITVRTPEPTFDAMLHRWTLYPALACRMWARSALYPRS